LSGTVTSPLGPIAGSRVLIQARTPEGGGALATTGSDGTFQVDFPKSVSRVVAVVSAPGFALRAFDAEAGDDPLLLPVTDENGSLEIALPMTGDELMRKNLVLATFQNGLPIPASALAQWAYDHGRARESTDQVLRIPDVAPGDYRVCLVPRQFESLLASMAVAAGADCAAGFLAPGSTLSLKPGGPG
jgi:hypothetical protein